MQFHLDVVKGRLAPERITVDALSASEAEAQAQAQGFTVLGVAAANRAAWRRQSASPSSNTVRKQLGVFVEQLASLLNAGLNLPEALATLRRGASGAWLVVLSQVEKSLREGQSLSACLAMHPEFPELLVALVRSSEVTSDLHSALHRYLDHERRASQVRHQIVSVALYPALLFMVGGAVLLFLLLYVMPRFARIFENMTQQLPWSAKAMVAWARLLHEHGAVLLPSACVVAGAALLVAMSPRSRASVMRWLLGLPGLADRLRLYFLARWYRTTALLVEGGIPLPNALSLAEHVLPAAMKDAARQVQRSMREGLQPSIAFSQGRMATPVAEQLLRAGERSGEVGAMLTRAADFHEAEVTRSLEKAMRVIEPLVMTGIGIGVGVVVVLMYLPIFELASAIQ